VILIPLFYAGQAAAQLANPGLLSNYVCSVFALGRRAGQGRRAFGGTSSGSARHWSAVLCREPFTGRV